MISDEAVEAAHERIANYLDDTEAESWKDVLRLALEAAAPHILAPRYDLGGFLESGVSQVVNTTGKPIAIQTNPYRSQP